MWRTSREPQRFNARPYPVARPKIFVPLGTPRARRRDAPIPNPFQNDPASSPIDSPLHSPLKPNLFGAFHFIPPPVPRPAVSRAKARGTAATNAVPPSWKSLARNPRFVRRPKEETPMYSPLDSPQTPFSAEPSPAVPSIPGAFPETENIKEPAGYFPAHPSPQQQPQHQQQPQQQPPQPIVENKEPAPQRKRRRGRDDEPEIARLRKSVRREFGDDTLDPEEKQLLKQLNALHMDYNYKATLHHHRTVMGRALATEEQRAKKSAKRDAEVEQLYEMELEAEESERQRAAETEKRRQIFQEERDKARKQQEAEARERERLKQWVEELAELGRQRERERVQREAQEKEDAERRKREEAEERQRMQDNIRRARALFSAGDAAAIRRQFEDYDGKWIELKDGRPLPPLTFDILPWPLLGPAVHEPTDITLNRVQEFVFHPLRRGVESKSRRDRVRSEILRWHPDKFNAKVLGKVIDTESVTEAAGRVARILTEMLEAETDKENRGF